MLLKGNNKLRHHVGEIIERVWAPSQEKKADLEKLITVMRADSLLGSSTC